MWDYRGELEWEVRWTSKDGWAGRSDAVSSEADGMQVQIVPRKKSKAAAREVRLAKVFRLRAAIAAGTYQVSVEELAEKMLCHARRQRAVTNDMYSV